MKELQVLVLGAGPAGLGAAYKLAQKGFKKVAVIERAPAVGGNAGSFELHGIKVDFGSHRLHPACDAEIMAEIKTLLQGDLLDRPRHGRIKLRGRWIHFPLKPFDLMTRLPPSFGMGVAWDGVGKIFRRKSGQGPENFASILEKGLGKTICRDFYFPYALKIWGVPVEELSEIQARRRVSAGSLGKMIKKVMAAVPGLKPKGSGRFFYPRQGFGQISESYYKAAQSLGVDIYLNTSVDAFQYEGRRVQTVTCKTKEGEELVFQPQQIWSTIPVSYLVQAANPAAPEPVLNASKNIHFRSMILIYLVLEQQQFTEYDAHYFPEKEIKITRLSETKNYHNTTEPKDTTVICAELPCSMDDPEWKMSNPELGELVCESLATAGIPVKSKVREVVTRRLSHAYPIYFTGYETHFEKLDAWVGGFENLLSFGRQGLFAHDNTHHTLYMAYAAVKDLDLDLNFDCRAWQRDREVFKTHVVED